MEVGGERGDRAEGGREGGREGRTWRVECPPDFAGVLGIEEGLGGHEDGGEEWALVGLGVEEVVFPRERGGGGDRELGLHAP
jgi:hypothetical protein